MWFFGTLLILVSYSLKECSKFICWFDILISIIIAIPIPLVWCSFSSLFLVVISVTKEGVKFSTKGDIGSANIVCRQNTTVDKVSKQIMVSFLFKNWRDFFACAKGLNVLTHARALHVISKEPFEFLKNHAAYCIWITVGCLSCSIMGSCILICG